MYYGEKVERIESHKVFERKNRLEELFKERHEKYLVAAYAIVKNWDEAEDSLQEAFFLALTHLESFREESSLNTWFYRILINQCFKKNQKKHKEIEHIGDSEWGFYDSSDLREDQVEMLEKQEISQAVSSAIDLLAAKYSLPLILHHFVGMRVEQVATILEVPQGTVKSRLHEARRQMAFFLERALGSKGLAEEFFGLF